MSDPTQCDRVLAYMRDHGAITPLEAIRDLAVMRLAARVSDLKHRGVRIETELVAVPNRYGEKTIVASYRIAS